MQEEPYIDPYTEGHPHERPPYERRALYTVIALVVAFVVFGSLISWFFFAPADYDGAEEERPADYAEAPGNPYDEGSGRSGVYNFFYEMFGGIEDGLDESPHNLNNIEQIDDFNIDTDEVMPSKRGEVSAPLSVKNFSKKQAKALQELQHEQSAQAKSSEEYRHSFSVIEGSSVFSSEGQKSGTLYDILINKETGAARAIVVNDEDAAYARDLKAIGFNEVVQQDSDGDVALSMTDSQFKDGQPFEYTADDKGNYISLRLLHSGQLLDYEGKVAGEIDAVIYENAEVQNIYFTLRPTLAQYGPSKLFIPFDEANIVRNQDGYDIQLTKEQTERLARTLFSGAKSAQ